MSSATPARLPLENRVSPIEIVCHRGALQSAPENTLASTEQAILCGADYIELDIHVSADQEYFVIHDATVDRTTVGSGTIANMSAAMLDSLDAGSWFGAEFAGEQLPRFTTLLQTVRGRSNLFVDFTAGVPEEIICAIREAGMTRDFFFWSEEPDFTDYSQRTDPDLRVMARLMDYASLDEAKARHGATVLEARMDEFTPELVGACVERDMELMICYQGKDSEIFRQIIEGGAHKINLDHLEPFLNVEASLASYTNGPQD